jgi:NAD(P)H-quinone oxidoreductase subunit 6
MSIIHLPESPQLPLILLLDLGIILGGLGVVLLRKIIYSALLLGLVFICVALFYLLLNADFLAAAQVLIYVGAVNVLIVFAIMLVNKPQTETTKRWTLGDGMSSIVSISLLALLITMISTTPWEQLLPVSLQNQENPVLGRVDTIGVHFLTDLLLPFELLSVLLLVALVGAITIARKEVPITVDTTSVIQADSSKQKFD